MPSIVTVPESGASRPTARLTDVLLPAPFGPSRPSTSPLRTESESPSTATILPKDLRTLSGSAWIPDYTARRARRFGRFTGRAAGFGIERLTWRASASSRPIESNGTGIGTELLVIFLLILANGVFAMSEIAVVAARKVRLQQRAEDGDERAKAALALAHDPNKFLSTVQFGITLVGVLAGAYGGATIAATARRADRAGPAARAVRRRHRARRSSSR